MEIGKFVVEIVLKVDSSQVNYPKLALPKIKTAPKEKREPTYKRRTILGSRRWTREEEDVIEKGLVQIEKGEVKEKKFIKSTAKDLHRTPRSVEFRMWWLRHGRSYINPGSRAYRNKKSVQV